MTMFAFPLMPQPILASAAASVVYAFKTSNFFSGQLIVAILFVGSIMAWTVMTTKYRELVRSQDDTTRFLGAWRREAQPLALFLKGQKFLRAPRSAPTGRRATCWRLSSSRAETRRQPSGARAAQATAASASWRSKRSATRCTAPRPWKP